MDTENRVCSVALHTDWIVPPADSRLVGHELNAAGASGLFDEIESDKGHDGVLLDEPEMFDAIDGFLKSAHKARGLPASGKEA